MAPIRKLLSRHRVELLGALFVAVCAVPLVRHAVKERQGEHEEREALALLERFNALQAQISPMEARAMRSRHVVINGQRIFFNGSTYRGGMASVVDTIREACKHTTSASALGGDEPRASDGKTVVSDEIRFERMDTQDAEGATAVLCTFREVHPAPGSSGTLVSYSLLKPLPTQGVSAITIATQSSAQLDSLFPDEGDAPGSDLPGVPRPRGSRRLFSADIEGAAYGVRVYEGRSNMAETVAAQDADMRAQGWSSSAAVAKALPDARGYSRDTAEVIASFSEMDGGTTVSFAARNDRVPDGAVTKK